MQERKLKPRSEHARFEAEGRVVLTARLGNSIKIWPNDLKILLMPGVYVFWIENLNTKEALYVGSSKRVMARMSNPNHTKAQQSLNECTLIEIFTCPDEETARQRELDLIEALNPRYNSLNGKK